MKSIEFNANHRKIFAEKLLELANIAAGALIFGQFISGKELSLLLVLVGLVTLIFSYVTAYRILKRKL